LNEARFASWRQAVQDVDRRVRRGGAKARTFRQMRDEEGLAARFRQRPPRLGKPDPIRVGLHDRGAFGGSGDVAQQTPVRCERAEVDREIRAVVGRIRWRVQSS
jgi:hypothetical protein